MRHLTLGAALLASVGTSPAAASIYTDDLTRCLVSKTSDADKKAVMRWMFAMMSASPEVSSMTTVTDAQRDAFNKGVGTVLGRLMLADCRAQAKAALQIDGPAAVGTAFEYVGKVAMQGLMQDQAVQAYMNKLNETVDPKEWEAFMAEAGVPTGSKKP